MRKKILVLTTGGTIEKSYDEVSGVFDNREQYLTNEISKRLRLPYIDIRFQSLMNKDSLVMTDDDRVLIYAAIHDWSKRVDGIVILHGTDTLEITAAYCHSQMGIHPLHPIPVIFTGAMSPFGFEQSDALQNMTEALIAVKILAPGLYVSFHNEIFSVPHVKKNKELRTFESTHPIPIPIPKPIPIPNSNPNK
jgi:L-asparaginase